MRYQRNTFLRLTAALAAAPALAQPVQFDWVTIGDPGNRGYDGASLDPNFDAVGRGAVNHTFQVSRTEVTSAQWVTFLNTFTMQSDQLSDFFGPTISWGGMVDPTYNGPGRRHVLRDDVPNAGQIPVAFTEWRQAVFFMNWLHNGQTDDPDSILSGAYDTVFGTNPDGSLIDDVERNAGARFAFPSRDEWMKAVHYAPRSDEHPDGRWYAYPYASDEPLTNGLPGEGQTSAGLDLPSLLPPVGSYPDQTAPWGLLDTSGGGGEWIESLSNNPGRHARAGSKASTGSEFQALFGDDQASVFQGDFLAGIRVIRIIPGPGPIALSAIALGTVCVRRRRHVVDAVTRHLRPNSRARTRDARLPEHAPVRIA